MPRTRISTTEAVKIGKRIEIKPRDLKLVKEAQERQAAGKRLTLAHEAAIERVKKAKLENDRWELYEKIPRAHWLALASIREREMRDQAAQYDFAMLAPGQRTINLGAFLQRFYQFIRKKGGPGRPRKDENGEDMLLASIDSPAQERYRAAMAALREMDVEERRGSLIRREDIQTGFAVIAQLLREAGESLKRLYGADAHRILDEALVAATVEIERVLSEEQKTIARPNGNNGNAKKKKATKR